MSDLATSSITVKGVRAQLRLADGTVTIHKQGDTVTAPSTVQFPVDRIRTTSLEVPRRGGRGWFHVAVVGGTPAPVGEMGAMSDPYALPITARSVGGCKRLARWVERHLRQHGLPSESVDGPVRFGSGVVVTGGASRSAEPEDAPPGSASDTDAAQQEAAAPTAATTTDGSSAPAKRPVGKAAKKRTVKKAAKKAAKKAVKKTAKTAKKTAKRTAKKRAVDKGADGSATKQSARRTRSRTGAAPKTPTAAAPAPVAGGSSVPTGQAQVLVDQLRQLGELHAAGVLTDEEFRAAKARVLG